MGRVSVRELRQNLSVHLRRVERGESLEVTRRGESVALLTPLPQRRTSDDFLAIEHGARRPIGRLEEIEPLAATEGPSLTEALEQQREERFG